MNEIIDELKEMMFEFIKVGHFTPKDTNVFEIGCSICENDKFDLQCKRGEPSEIGIECKENEKRVGDFHTHPFEFYASPSLEDVEMLLQQNKDIPSFIKCVGSHDDDSGKSKIFCMKIKKEFDNWKGHDKLLREFDKHEEASCERIGKIETEKGVWYIVDKDCGKEWDKKNYEIIKKYFNTTIKED